MAKLDKEYFEKKIETLKGELETCYDEVKKSQELRASLKEQYRVEEQRCIPIMVRGREIEIQLKENEDLLGELNKE